MIDETDDLLVQWAGTVLPRADVSLERPQDERAGSGVSIHLLDLVANPLPRANRKPTLLRMSLRYLVTTWADDPRAAHKLLGELAFAAMEEADFDVELEPLPAAFWEALGVSPRAHLLLRVPVRRQSDEPAPKLVEKPLVVHATDLTTLEGVIVGPKDVPVPDAFVELPALQRFTRSDGNGRFSFTGIPAEPPVKNLLVHTKGRDFAIDRDSSSDGRPLVIELEFVEA
jgi:hypothetical protein